MPRWVCRVGRFEKRLWRVGRSVIRGLEEEEMELWMMEGFCLKPNC
jgi:hypothetical protein